MILPFSISLPGASVPSAGLPNGGFPAAASPNAETVADPALLPELAGPSVAPGFPVAPRAFAAVWSEAKGRERTAQPKGESAEQDKPDASFDNAALAAMLSMRPLATRQLQIVMHSDSAAEATPTDLPDAAKNENPASDGLNGALLAVPAMSGQTALPQDSVTAASAMPEAINAKPERAQAPAAAVPPSMMRPDNHYTEAVVEAGLPNSPATLPQHVPVEVRAQRSTETTELPARPQPSKPVFGESFFAAVTGKPSTAPVPAQANPARPDRPAQALPSSFPFSEPRIATALTRQTPEYAAHAALAEASQPFTPDSYSSGPQTDSPLPFTNELALPVDDRQMPDTRRDAARTETSMPAAMLFSQSDHTLPVSATEMPPPADLAEKHPAGLVAPAPQTESPQQNTGRVADKVLSLDLFANETAAPEKQPGQGDHVASEVLNRDSAARPSTSLSSETEREFASHDKARTGDIDGNTVKAGHAVFPSAAAEVSTETTERPKETAEVRPVVMPPLQDDAPMQRSGEARHIAVDVRGEDGSVVQVRFSASEAGHLQLNVHSNDEVLSHEVRAGAADLITRLEDSGFEVRPADTASPDANTDTNDERRRKHTAPEEEEIGTRKKNRGSADSAFQVQRT